MIIFAIDDEAAMLSELHEAIREACPEAEIHDFRFAADVLKAITEGSMIPDIVFSDIELPGMNGLELAVIIKQLAPVAKIIFVTGYSQYALEAYRQHINGYVLKPIDAEQIRRELDYLMEPYRQESGKLQVRCFGNFEVYWKGKPVSFGRKQTKELFAFLIDRNGICTSEEISDALWEGDTDIKACKTRLRSLLHDLKRTLTETGVSNLKCTPCQGQFEFLGLPSAGYSEIIKLLYRQWRIVQRWEATRAPWRVCGGRYQPVSFLSVGKKR